MGHEIVFYEKKESIASISFRRAISIYARYLQAITELEEIRNEISSDNGVTVVITSGQEIFLSEGKDKEFLSLKNGTQFINRIRLSSVLAALDRPTIAAIRGDAMGQGLELALACDIRIAADTAHFGFPHIKEGLIPRDGGTQRLSRVVGQAKAMEMIITGEIIDAQEAYQIGLVHRVVPEPELLPAAMGMAREMASKGAIALRYAKEAINKGMDLTLEQGLRLEADLYCLLHTTKDRTEGIKAFQEKRSPEFNGE